MKEINTVDVNGETYGILAITNPDFDIFAYAIPIQEFNTHNMFDYEGVEKEELPQSILEGIKMKKYIRLNIAFAVCV